MNCCFEQVGRATSPFSAKSRETGESLIRGNPAAILRAVQAGDLQAARGLGHNMKGTGTAYGFPVITDLGAQIEQAAKEEKLDTLRSKVSELASYLEGLKPEYP